MATKERGAKRERRQYTDEFRAGAVRLVLEEGGYVAPAEHERRFHESRDAAERAAPKAVRDPV